MKLSFRTILIAVVYMALFAIVFHAPTPKPIVAVPYTEIQIMERLKIERIESERNKAIRRATAAARAVYRANGCRDTYSDLTGRTAYERGISARLLAAVVFVESSCDPRTISRTGDIGLLQVNPRVWGHRSELKDPVSNMRIGSHILKQYIARYGVREGLHRYNGLGNPTDSYAVRIFAAGGITL